MSAEEYLLMNQNKPALMFMLTETGEILIKEIAPDVALPYYLENKEDDLRGEDIKDWLNKRCFPELRANGHNLQEYMGCDKKYLLAIKNCALSLCDSYWIKPASSSLSWENINFFENSYSQAAGLYLLGDKEVEITEFSPDICTNGVQPKLWIKENGANYLLKFGRPPYYQEPLNEVICSSIAVTFPFLDAVVYTEDEFMGKTVSKCENFVCPGIELVPAYCLYNKDKDVLGSVYFSILQKAKHLGMDIEEYINELIIFDYMINNTDRNLGNIGFLRDMDTGEFLGPAPVYDNGNSMWFDSIPDILNDKDEVCKPFANNFKTQLKLVKNAKISFSEAKYFCYKALDGLSERIDNERFEKIEQMLGRRLNYIENKYVYSKYKTYDKSKNKNYER